MSSGRPTPSSVDVVDVSVDGRWAGLHGIGRYRAEIVPRLGADPRLRTDVIVDERVGPADALDPLWLRREIRRRRPDVFFSPGYNCALAPRVSQLLVVHDLIHLRVPEESSLTKRVYYDRLVRPVIRAAGCVTVSEFSKRDIVDWSGVDPDTVLVAPGALSWVPPRVPRREADGTGLTVLFVGNAKPHKNLALLVAAMAHLPADSSLVCVGITDAEVASLSPRLDPSRVSCRNGVSDEELASLYAAADCLAFPSTYEGFGLPALEALAQRTPVAYVCDAVAETVGPGAGVRCEQPESPAAFADAVVAASLLGGPDFDAAAAARVAAYDWDRSARRIGDALLALATG